MRSFHIGEAVIDFASIGDLCFQGSCGGSPLNTAIAVARLGQCAGYITQLSTDLFGQRLRRHMDEHGLDTRFLLSHDAPTTLAFVEHSEAGNRYQFLAQGSADFLYAPDPLPVLPEDTALLQFGSVSLALEPSATSIERLVRTHRHRMVVVLDPNVRPTVIPDMTRYRQRLRDWLPLCHVLKLSEEDAALIGPGPIEDQAVDWLTRGPQAVLVTLGAKGARVFLPGGVQVHADSPAVRLCDSVGAGDTFTAATMVALMERGIDHPSRLTSLGAQDWQAMAHFACTAAALCCTRAGASPPTREELALALKT